MATVTSVIYPAAAFAVLHGFWIVKQDITQPMIYAFVLAVLLGLRMWWRYSIPTPIRV